MTRRTDYVKNSELYEEFKLYYEKKQEWIASGKDGTPPLTDIIGKAIMQIAYKRCNSRQFYQYTNAWKDEMIADAIEVCVRYAHNFNPNKSNNPFAYLTQLVTNAIIQRIKKEKRQQYLRYKMFAEMNGFQGDTDNLNDEDMEFVNDATDMFKDHLEFIAEYEKSNKPKPIEKLNKKKDIGLEDYME